MIPTLYLRACISTLESDYKSTRLALDEVKSGLYFALNKANKDVRLYLDDVKLRHACQCLEQSDWGNVACSGEDLRLANNSLERFRAEYDALKSQCVIHSFSSL